MKNKYRLPLLCCRSGLLPYFPWDDSTPVTLGSMSCSPFVTNLINPSHRHEEKKRKVVISGVALTVSGRLTSKSGTFWTVENKGMVRLNELPFPRKRGFLYLLGWRDIWRPLPRLPQQWHPRREMQTSQPGLEFLTYTLSHSHEKFRIMGLFIVYILSTLGESLPIHSLDCNSFILELGGHEYFHEVVLPRQGQTTN